MKHLGMNYSRWDESKVTPCTSVSEGDLVIVNVGTDENPRCLRGKVIVAAGYNCFVSTSDGDSWFHVSDCAVENKDINNDLE